LSCGIICLLIPYLLYLFIKWFIFRLPWRRWMFRNY
jgi:hypothetical protein